MKIRLPVVVTGLTMLLTLAFFNFFQSVKSFAANLYIEGGEETVVFVPVEEEVHSERFTVVIDPGHGGKDTGAQGFSGQYEKDFTLSLAKKIAERLKQHREFKVYLTRETDTFLSAKKGERQEFANQIRADIYISVHGNTFTNPAVSGTETYYFSENSIELARILHKKIVSAAGFADRGVRKEPYLVLKGTDMPAVLLEIGYLTNPENEEKMFSTDFQQRIADAVYEGILEYRNLQKDSSEKNFEEKHT